MTCSWEGDSRCEHPAMVDNAHEETEGFRFTTMRERDQARAEVERLRGLLRRADPFLSGILPTGDAVYQLRRDIEEALRG